LTGSDQDQASAQNGGRNDKERDHETAVAREQAFAPVVVLMIMMIVVVMTVAVTMMVVVTERHRRVPG
jgi:ABC-type Na+ efflux pump permease subunit